MSDSDQTRTVELSRVYDAPIELVYRAWTEGEHVARWMKCDPEATMTVENWEPRVGAEFRSHMVKPGVFEMHGTGRVIEADPPRVFAYRTDADPALGAPELTVRIVLEEVDEGTKLTLTHSGLPNDDFCGIVEGGWSVSLELLRDVLVTLIGAYASGRFAQRTKRDAEAEASD